MIAETAVAAPVVRWLQGFGWNVYQEVQIHSLGAVADIVAERDGRVWVVETKTRLCLDLLGQALSWRRYAHWSSVAFPQTKHRAGFEFAEAACRTHGIGMLEVRLGDDSDSVSERLAPDMLRGRKAGEYARRWWSKDLDRMRAALVPERIDFAEAGNATGLRWTPWQGTCAEVHRFVTQNPGVTVSEMVKAMGQCHYASSSTARVSLAKWALLGKIRNVRAERDGRKIRLYPETPARLVGIAARTYLKGQLASE